MNKLFSHKLHLILFAYLLCMGGMSKFAHAQISITVDQPLNFGTYVIADFSSVAQITIRDNGSFTHSTNVYPIIDPTRGEYTLEAPSNLNAVYTITVPSSFIFSGGPGGSFTLDNISVRPNLLRTDGTGQDQFTLAGRLRSSGGGVFYGDGTYSDSFTITVNF